MLTIKGLFRIIPLLLLLAASCNLEKEIDLNLPEYDPQVVVECYVEPDKPFRLLLTRSAAYFAPINLDDQQFLENLLVDSAQVIISSGNQEYSLENGLYFDPQTRKVHNYQASERVEYEPDREYRLSIRLKDGQTIVANTRMLPRIPIDSVVVQFETDEPDDTLARLITHLTDPDPETENYLRRQLHYKSLLDSIPDQDFIATDEFSDNGRIVFGTGYDFAVGDTVYNTLFHISKPYYEYLGSYFNAVLSNGNPFGQPSTIQDNLEGTADAIGIFTALTFQRDTTVIKK